MNSVDNGNSRTPTLSSVIYPEKEKSFKYLSKYLKYTPIDKIYKGEIISELITKEKLFHYKITNYSQYKITQLKAWSEYISWVQTIIPKAYEDELRLYLTLENYTRSMITEKVFYDSKGFLFYILLYIDMCKDDIDIIKQFYKNGICHKNYLLYDSFSILYEKFHDFKNANNIYLTGFDNKVNDIESLQKKYKLFENRMLNRINREIAGTQLNSETIDDYLHTEIAKGIQPKFNKQNKRMLNDNGEANLITMIFKIRNNKIEISEDEKGKTSVNNKNQTTIKYGEVPIFVDEEFRNNLITKGTQLVEIYCLLDKFLTENDYDYQKTKAEFKARIKAEYDRRPYSFFSGKRDPGDYNTSLSSLENSVCDPGNNSDMLKTDQEKNPNKELTVDDVVKNMIEKDIRDSEKKNKENKAKTTKEKHFSGFDSIKPLEGGLIEQGQASLYNSVKGEESKTNLVSNGHSAVVCTKTKKDNVVHRIKYEDGDYLLDKRILYAKEQLKESREKAKKLKEDLERQKEEKTSQPALVPEKILLDSDGDLCMDMSQGNSAIERREETNTENKQQIQQLQPIVPVQPVQQTEPKQSKNLIDTINPLDVSRGEQKSMLFNKSMTPEEIDNQINQINDQFEKGKINYEQRNRYFTMLDEKLNQMVNQKKMLNAIEPLDENKIINPKGNNDYPITPQKKEFSLSFDSDHSHLFTNNGKQVNQGKPGQVGFTDLFKDSPVDTKNRLNSFFDDANVNVTNGNLAQYFQPSSQEDVSQNNHSKIEQFFFNDDPFESEDKAQNKKNCMSSITEKTIENTRNSSDLSIDKLFKS